MTGPGPVPGEAPAPGSLPGLDPRWSRRITARDGDGILRTWHVLDSRPEGAAEEGPPRLTLLCVHGNPTWSYLWRRVLATAPADVRVVAIDHLDMGYSERTHAVRRLADRVDDLGRLTQALGIEGPVVTVAHDWGGPISLGWALAHREDLAGVVLLNTAVHQPADSASPTVIRMARWSPVLRANTVRTPTFVRATTLLSAPRMPREVAAAYAAPYRRAEDREAIGAFVADIPLEPDHPSATTLDAIAEGIRGLTDVPALLLWGPDDPVFSDRYLADLQGRLPHADVHRYEKARHLVIEDAPSLVDDLWAWLDARILAAPTGPSADGLRAGPAPADVPAPVWAGLERRATATPSAPALAVPRRGGWQVVSWDRLARNVDLLARGLARRGVRRGDRVAVLVPPGPDLLALVYACWRIGASVVVTDAGLGIDGIRRALRGAAPRHVIGIPRALALVRATRIGGARIPVRELPAIARLGEAAVLPDPPGPDDEAAVVFTSGATGPAKGVVYRHRQVGATRDLLARHYGITDDDVIVAAFAPWAVLGPALGIASAIPDMDVTSPRTLRAAALADAVAVLGGTLLWASPAALASVLGSAADLTAAQRAAFGSLRLVLGAGAPVPPALLHGMRDLCPTASVRTPYGMTEALPVCDVTVEEIDAAGRGDGVLVGRPLPGVDVAVSPLGHDGSALAPLTTSAGVLGEIAVRGIHVRDHYDRLWAAQARSTRDPGWHRTGDVGHLDEAGRLWVGGRLAHVVTTAEGPLAPVGVEQRVQSLGGFAHAACVGVGPVGDQVVVVVVAVPDLREGPAPLPLVDRVRETAGVPVAAVLVRHELPVDIRHNSKVDRGRLATWAARILAGRDTVTGGA